MKILVTAQNADSGQPLDVRFGRCPIFIIYDTEQKTFEAVNNPGSESGGGAGIAAAQKAAELKVDAVITGQVGPNAFEVLNAANIKVYTGQSGIVRDILENWQTIQIEPQSAPTVQSHHGMRPAPAVTGINGDRRIAVAAESDDGLNAQAAHHFGRCPFYTMIDLIEDEIMAVSSCANPFFQAHQPGQVPLFIKEQQADVMIAGGMGQRAVQFFNEFGIEAATGAQGSVQNALEAYLKGELAGAQPCSGHAHGCDH